MKRSGLLAGCAALVVMLSGHAAGQSVMTNQEVVRMVAAGLADDVIITAIRQAPQRNFDLSTDGLIALKREHVPDVIVRAMQQAAEDGGRRGTEPRPMTPPAAGPPPGGSRPTPAAAPIPPPSAAAAPQEPSTIGELFAVGHANGELIPLERVAMRERKVGGSRSQGVFKPSVQDYAYYFDGNGSPATIKSGDPQLFVIRLLGPADRKGLEPTAQEAAKHFLLTKLEVQDGVRYITKQDVQFDIRTYGSPRPGMDSRRPDRLAVSFELTPRSVLGPGEYVILLGGTSNYTFIDNHNVGLDRWAFAILAR